MHQVSRMLRDVNRCTDRELICQLQSLVRADWRLSVRLLVHLGEVDARRSYREQAYTSMFEYGVRALRMSEAEAYTRIHAARLGRQFPLEQVPSAVQQMRTSSAHDVSAQAVPQVASSVVHSGPASNAHNVPAGLAEPGPGDEQRSGFALQSPAPRARASSAPLSPGRYKLQLSVGQEVHDKLMQLKELLRHRVPDGDLARVFELAVDVLLDKTLKERFAQTAARKKSPAARTASACVESASAEKHSVEASAAGHGPQQATAVTMQVRLNATVKRAEVATTAEKPIEPSAGDSHETRAARSRYVARKVLRDVFARDRGQCTFVSAEGQRCSARGFLEVHHHDTPYARGGMATVENLRLMCRAHNALLAERDLGRGFMLRKLLQATAARAESRCHTADASPSQEALFRP